MRESTRARERAINSASTNPDERAKIDESAIVAERTIEVESTNVSE